VGPVDIVGEPRARRVYVLNSASNTVSTVSASLFRPDFRFPVDRLAAYRKAAVEAFADLLGGFLQYLKDCLCDHFLVNCPTCSEDDKLYLACISIRDGQVYNVCNFSKRRYVKSFPTVDYWLSLVPVIPLLGHWLERFCCSILPDLFRRYTVPEFDAGQSLNPQPNLRVRTARDSVTSVQQANLPTLLRNVLDQSRVVTTVARDAVLRQPTPLQLRAGDPRLAASNLVEQPTERVATLLRERGVEVERAPYNPAAQADLAASLASFLKTPAAGSKVTLYEETGQVRYYSVVEPREAPEAVKLRGDVESLKAELTRVQQAHREEITMREREIAALRGSVDALRGDLSVVGELKEQLTALLRRRSPRRSSGEGQ
jgi:hypothetical protein